MHAIRCSSVAVSFLALVTTLWASEATASPVITKEMALKAIAIFRDDPFSELGRGAAAIIVTFVDKSPDVIVRIAKKTVPFIDAHGVSKEEMGTLLAAFVAGNLDSQLLRGVKKDDSYAGDLQLIETYQQLKQRNRKLHIPEIENLAEMNRRGQLKSYVSSK